MKNSTILLAMLASAMSTNLVVAEDNSTQLNPMVQIELTASMKSDWTLASRLIVLDIRDDLTDKQKLSIISAKFMVSEFIKSTSSIAHVDSATTQYTSTSE